MSRWLLSGGTIGCSNPHKSGTWVKEDALSFPKHPQFWGSELYSSRNLDFSAESWDFPGRLVLRSFWLQSQVFGSKIKLNRPFKGKEGFFRIVFFLQKSKFPKCLKFVLRCLELPRRLPATPATLWSPLSVAHTPCGLPPPHIWENVFPIFSIQNKVPSLALNGRSGLDLEPKVDPNTGHQVKSHDSALKWR